MMFMGLFTDTSFIVAKSRDNPNVHQKYQIVIESYHVPLSINEKRVNCYYMQQHDGYHKEYYWLKSKLVRFHFIKVKNRHT